MGFFDCPHGRDKDRCGICALNRVESSVHGSTEATRALIDAHSDMADNLREHHDLLQKQAVEEEVRLQVRAAAKQAGEDPDIAEAMYVSRLREKEAEAAAIRREVARVTAINNLETERLVAMDKRHRRSAMIAAISAAFVALLACGPAGVLVSVAAAICAYLCARNCTRRALELTDQKGRQTDINRLAGFAIASAVLPGFVVRALFYIPVMPWTLAAVVTLALAIGVAVKGIITARQIDPTVKTVS